MEWMKKNHLLRLCHPPPPPPHALTISPPSIQPIFSLCFCDSDIGHAGVSPGDFFLPSFRKTAFTVYQVRKLLLDIL